jgi:hypothetical protein
MSSSAAPSPATATASNTLRAIAASPGGYLFATHSGLTTSHSSPSPAWLVSSDCAITLSTSDGSACRFGRWARRRNRCRRRRPILNVGVHGVGVPSEHIKLDRAVAFGCLGIANRRPAHSHSGRDVAGAQTASDANFGEPTPARRRWPREPGRPAAVSFDGVATLCLYS